MHCHVESVGNTFLKSDRVMDVPQNLNALENFNLTKDCFPVTSISVVYFLIVYIIQQSNNRAHCKISKWLNSGCRSNI